MREIKFRSWSKTPFGNYRMSYRPSAGYNPSDINNAINYESKERILMQYTGLTDKNGTEIYEGDILRGYDGSDDKTGEIFVVKWSDFYTGFYPLNSDTVLVNRDTFEVIGNIYEHPELLEGDSQ